MNFFGIPVKSFNLEITNKCTLACSECARTGNDWVRKNLTDLPVSVLENVFPLAHREQFEGIRVNMCGAYGDCIYHRDFHGILRHLKAAGVRIGMETNGSYKSLDWWRETCEILDERDAITFSVDGLEDTNHIYRVNARWDDIAAAMRYCAPRVPVGWKYIVFRHNEHQLDEAEALAREIGVRQLTFKKSARFRVDDPLAPKNEDFIGVVTRNRRAIRELEMRDVGGAEFDRQVAIRSKCRYGFNLAVTALGYFFPCTSCESSDTTTWFHQNREHFDLRRYTIDQILASAKWLELERLWQSASAAPASCLQYCGVHRDFEARYPTESREDRPFRPDDSINVDFEYTESL